MLNGGLKTLRFRAPAGKRLGTGFLEATPPGTIKAVAAGPASEWITAKEIEKKVAPAMSGGAMHLAGTCRADQGSVRSGNGRGSHDASNKFWMSG
jgi:hypothetical protein